jgi:hypothetical protein
MPAPALRAETVCRGERTLFLRVSRCCKLQTISGIEKMFKWRSICCNGALVGLGSLVQARMQVLENL